MNPLLNQPKTLPFLEAIGWQIADVRRLMPEEMLSCYERNWRYRDVLGELSAEEATFVEELCDRYGSWITMDLRLATHQQILEVLQQLKAPFLRDCCAYFGGGTYLAIKHGEYRLSRDIDFLCSSQQGYRLLRRELADQGYRALFASQDGISFPRDIRTDQYGIRFPVIVGAITLKLEIISEGRIDLEDPEFIAELPIACLSQVDCFAEELLANADRWLDRSVESRDLIDLAILRSIAPIPDVAIAKAEAAYSVMAPLQQSLINFQEKPDYRQRCYQSLQVKSPVQIIDGIDRLAADLNLPATQRLVMESAPI